MLDSYILKWYPWYSVNYECYEYCVSYVYCYVYCLHLVLKLLQKQQRKSSSVDDMKIQMLLFQQSFPKVTNRKGMQSKKKIKICIVLLLKLL